MKKYKTSSPIATKKLAAFLAKKVRRAKIRLGGAIAIGLTGELGSGKTTFIQGFAKELGIKRRLTSPTFLIIRSYELPARSYKLFYHVDCYRIKRVKELNQLGFKKIITEPKNIVLIEWAEKIKKSLPKNTLWLKFAHDQKENERIIKIYENSSSYRR